MRADLFVGLAVKEPSPSASLIEAMTVLVTSFNILLRLLVIRCGHDHAVAWGTDVLDGDLFGIDLHAGHHGGP